MYHRVAECGTDPWRLCVSRRNFADHLEVLRRCTTVVRLQDLPERLRRGTTRRPFAVITFDDGYADNLIQALPALSDAGLPATVFIATGWIGRERSFWWDELTAIIFSADRVPDSIETRFGEAQFSWQEPGATAMGAPKSGARSTLHRQLWTALRRLTEADRDKALLWLRGWAGQQAVHEPLARPMTAAEVAELQRSGLVEIGAHARTHRPLTGLSIDERWHEIDGSRQDCGRLAGVTPQSFAYPHGDLDDRTAALVARAGFSVAVVAQPGLVWPGADRFRLRRCAVDDVGGEAFERRLRTEWLP
jgi:peptidoglycan/xylan/chitin deacetylase (PgdA/CDA1 family)